MTQNRAGLDTPILHQPSNPGHPPSSPILGSPKLPRGVLIHSSRPMNQVLDIHSFSEMVDVHDLLSLILWVSRVSSRFLQDPQSLYEILSAIIAYVRDLRNSSGRRRELGGIWCSIGIAARKMDFLQLPLRNSYRYSVVYEQEHRTGRSRGSPPLRARAPRASSRPLELCEPPGDFRIHPPALPAPIMPPAPVHQPHLSVQLMKDAGYTCDTVLGRGAAAPQPACRVNSYSKKLVTRS